MSSFREISCDTITKTVRKLFLDANTVLGNDVLSAVEKSIDREESELGRYALEKNRGKRKNRKRNICTPLPGYGSCGSVCRTGTGCPYVGGNLMRLSREGSEKLTGTGF